MKKSLAIVSAILAHVCRASAADTAEMENTRAEFESLGTQLPYLSLGAVLYDRPDDKFQVNDSIERQEHDRIIARATDGSHSKDSLLSLTHHASARVRTLAAVALFDREDPSVLPALAALCDDLAPTFHDFNRGFANYPQKAPEVEQTVGGVARRMVGFYVPWKNFDDYWAVRSNRAHSAGWFSVQLVRARQGILGGFPTQPGCLERTEALRRRIDRLPPDERGWILLSLSDNWGTGRWDSQLVSETELVEACKGLGPEKLILMLHDKTPSDDPDLKTGSVPMVRFVLAHATELLRPEDSDTLVARELWHRANPIKSNPDAKIFPLWAIAAANLKPQQASNILHAAWPRYQARYQLWDRVKLAVALWKLVGEPEQSFLADWFYNEIPQWNSIPNHQRSFIDAMGNASTGRTMVAHLVRDRRFDRLDWGALRGLVDAVNRWSKEPIVAEDELKQSKQRFGDGTWDGRPFYATDSDALDWGELRKLMARWCVRLRESVPRWLNGE